MEEDHMEKRNFYDLLKSKEKLAKESAELALNEGNMNVHNYQEGKRFAFRLMAENFSVEFL